MVDTVTRPIDNKRVPVDECIARIPDGATVATSGFVGAAVPEKLLVALQERYLESGHPRDLTLMYAAGQGDGAERGLNHLAHVGLLKRVIGGHWGLAPKLGQLAREGAIEAYNLPQGVICQLYRDIAAHRPGCITHVGLDTFIDPSQQSGRLNATSPDDLVQRVELGGETYLWYKAIPIQVGLVRASSADVFGNLSMGEEVIVGEVLPIAQAARNGGGFVIAQVKRILDHPLPPHQVHLPGALVDWVVVAEDDQHPQTFGSVTPDYCSAQEGAVLTASQQLPPGARRIIAARACDELPVGALCNLGIGMPEGIAQIAAERGMLDRITLTVESGPIGGVPAGGLAFGASAFPQAIIDQPAMFDFYDGGGLDFAALGAAQVDGQGNVNVSKFGPRLAGVGGFVNITQNAKRVVFCGTLTAGGLQVAFDGAELQILKEGRERKFLKRVEQVSFSSLQARRRGQEILYITERAVFRLGDEGLQLIEVAPGIDVQRDVLDQMDCQVVVQAPQRMPAHVFE